MALSIMTLCQLSISSAGSYLIATAPDGTPNIWPRERAVAAGIKDGRDVASTRGGLRLGSKDPRDWDGD